MRQRTDEVASIGIGFTSEEWEKVNDLFIHDEKRRTIEEICRQAILDTADQSTLQRIEFLRGKCTLRRKEVEVLKKSIFEKEGEVSDMMAEIDRLSAALN